ncbi:MAG: helix-turn-helix domain-containing protein [Lachnospiraceae bacterium]
MSSTFVVFQKSLGKTPVSYINDFRIRHAATLLRTTELQVTEVCLESGFNNLGHFMKEFKKATGFTLFSSAGKI